MKINNTEENIHILNSDSNVWSIVKGIAESTNQEDAFYVCDIGNIVKKYKTWQEKLPRIVPHYAVKCNDNLLVLEVLSALGTGFDCASKGEMNKVMSMGVEADRIIFANPAKPASHIRHAQSVGVATMTFDNETELHKIKRFYPDAKLVIRLRCDAADAQCQLGMKFGCDPLIEAPELLQTAQSLGLSVIGVSFHVGSGCREPEVFQRAIAASRRVFDYGEAVGYHFELLDIGGGFPGDRGSSIDKMAGIINLALQEYFPDPSIRVIAEPGRFFVSSAYTLVCNIHSIRNVIQTAPESDTTKLHRMYYINDGIYGSFNCILYDHQVVVPQVLHERPGGTYYSSSIWGPTCDGLDQVVEDVMLPELKVGDWLVFENMGAYTLPVASTFNGFPIPRVHVVVDSDIWEILSNILSLTNEHFDMVSRPSNFKIGLNINFEMPDLPICLEIPNSNGSIEEHILELVEPTCVRE